MPKVLLDFFHGQEISFGNRHGQNFCYAKTTSSPCFFGFSNRHNMVKAFLLRSKFTNSLREQLRCRRTFWRFALKTVCDRPVFFGVHTLQFPKGSNETFIKMQFHCIFREKCLKAVPEREGVKRSLTEGF